MAFIGTWLATAAAAGITAWIVPGMNALGGTLGILVFALAVALVNATVRPLMEALSLPLNVATLGVFRFVVNAAALVLASWLSVTVFGMGVHFTGFLPALLGSLIISVVSMVIDSLTGVQSAT